MNAITYNAWNPRQLGFVIVFTVLINGSLFVALPWLTRIVKTPPTTGHVSPDIFFLKKQPKPLEPVKKTRILNPDLQPLPKPPIQPDIRRNNVPDFDFVKDGLGDGVPVVTNGPEQTLPIWEDIIFEPNQLDKEPRIIRKILPVYPFAAKSQGIKARVKIRCLVDKDGMPQKVVAAECEPEDALDIFGPPAVKAVEKWRFCPGEIGGDPVLTKVAFNVFFEMD